MATKVLIVESIAKIRKDYYALGRSIRRIARDRKVSRNTVRKTIRAGQVEFGYVHKMKPLPSWRTIESS